MPLVTVPVNDVGQFGIISDRRGHELPLNAWTAGNNMRPRNLFMEKYYGNSQRMGSPLGPVYNLMPVFNSATLYWLYLSLTNGFAWDGTTHTDITRAVGGNYSALADTNWVITNCMGIPVMTNGVDVPQMWNQPTPAQKLAALTAWNANWTCRSIRAFKSFLVALDVVKTGTRYPQMVKWSHEAVAGNVPASWDETDPSKDAGEYLLMDSPGYCLDGITLRDVLIIYKEDAIWAMQFVGGQSMFRFVKIFDGIGALSRRCAVEFFDGQHFVFGTNDVIVHDGANKRSVVDKKQRVQLFSSINSAAYQRCFVTINWIANEVWACYPSGNSTLCDQALVWNWNDDTVTFRDLPLIAAATPGILLDNSVADTWSSASGSWATDPLRWSDRLFNPTIRKLFMGRPSAQNILMADDSSTNTNEGTPFTAYVERKHMGMPFRANTPPDMQSVKFCSGIWPRIEGTNGGTVNVYIGSSPDPETDPTYSGPFPFVIGTTRNISCRVSGRLLAVKFVSNTDIDWRIHGYELEVSKGGRY